MVTPSTFTSGSVLVMGVLIPLLFIVSSGWFIAAPTPNAAASSRTGLPRHGSGADAHALQRLDVARQRIATLEREIGRLRAAPRCDCASKAGDHGGPGAAVEVSPPASAEVTAPQPTLSVVGAYMRRRDVDGTGAGAQRPSFKAIGDRHRDDKTHRHRYDVAYTIYLSHLRGYVNGAGGGLQLLEIGLGCDQERIGASVMLWGEYLPHATLSVFEFDEKCGRKFAASEQARRGAPRGGLRMHYGDQAKAEDLRRMLAAEAQSQRANASVSGISDALLAASTGDVLPLYDVVIDDGGHTMDQQITSFKVLWPHVKRHGVYVIEDLNTSFKTRYGGGKRPADAKSGVERPTTTNMIKGLLDALHAVPVPGHPGKYAEDTEFRSPYGRVDCFHFVCFITKA